MLDHQSSYPLSRSLIRLEPLPGSPSTLRPLQTRSGRSGQFQFVGVFPGQYRLTAQRTGYFPIGYAQRRPTGQALPFTVTEDSNLFAELRARRLGVVTGTVYDENSVGIPGVPVLAYAARLPLGVAARAITDDRGVYRLTGLLPGKYWVRSGAATLEDSSGLLPIFSPQARETRDARLYTVHLDTEATDATLRPEGGNLLRLSVRIGCQGPPAQLTLSSELTSQQVTVACLQTHTFENLPPAQYELLAVTPAGLADFWTGLLTIETNRVLQPQFLPELYIEPNGPPLTARRHNLHEISPAQTLKGPRAALLPGHWEFSAATPPDRYLESVRLYTRPPNPFVHLIPAGSMQRLQLVISDQAGQLTGEVPVVGIPVYLYPVSETNRRILGGLRETVADLTGAFRFTGLPPGDYRLMATFDYTSPDLDAFEEARAVTITITARQVTTTKLTQTLAP